MYVYERNGDYMFGLIADFFAIMLAFIVLFSIICFVTGDEAKGNSLILNTVTTMIFYGVIVSVYNLEGSGNSIFKSALPMMTGIDQYGTVLAFVKAAPNQFALDFVELVTLSMIISCISNLISFQSAGVFGKILSRIILIFAGITLYGIVMDSISDNKVIKWGVYAIEAFITMGSIAYTPLMLAANITGLKHQNWLLIYLVNEFPKCKFGKAVSAAMSSVVMFLVLIVILESQYGSIKFILRGSTAMLENMGGVVVMCMGFYAILGSLRSGKK